MTCSACREFAVGRRLHPGHEAPKTWTATQLEYVAYLARLDELAQQHGIPAPLDAAEASGAWAHFVLAVHAYQGNDFEQARVEARQALMHATPRGWAGLQHHAELVESAANQALAGTARPLPRHYKARANVEFPSLPADVDFKQPAWQCYEAAIQVLRANQLEKAYQHIYAGINLAGGPDAVSIEAVYLKQLGHAITRARKPKKRFDLKAQPSRPRDVQAVLAHYQIEAAEEDCAEPGWATLAKGWIAIDHGAWQSAYAHVDEARYLEDFTQSRQRLAVRITELESRIPVPKRPSNYAIKRNGRIHVPGFVRTRKTLHRRGHRDGTASRP